MKVETSTVSPDEACYGLHEGPQMLPGPNGSQRLRWAQTVKVIRGDEIAEHTRDFGPVESYAHVIEFFMPSFGDDTVAQLREHAEKNRHDTYWQGRAKAQRAESTLIRDHIEQIEMAQTYLNRHQRTAKELTR